MGLNINILLISFFLFLSAIQANECREFYSESYRMARDLVRLGEVSGNQIKNASEIVLAKLVRPFNFSNRKYLIIINDFHDPRIEIFDPVLKKSVEITFGYFELPDGRRLKGERSSEYDGNRYELNWLGHRDLANQVDLTGPQNPNTVDRTFFSRNIKLR